MNLFRTLLPLPRLQKPLHCSFCEKEQRAVQKLIAGPHAVLICDECVRICDEILVGEDISPGDRRISPASRKYVNASEHIAGIRKLIDGGEYKSAGRLVRNAALITIAGLLELAGDPATSVLRRTTLAAFRGDVTWMGQDAYSTTDIGLINTSLFCYAEMRKLLQETDKSHLILRMSLDGAIVAADDAECALRALNEALAMLKRQIDSVGEKSRKTRTLTPEPPGT